MIELTDVTKRYGSTMADDQLSFEVRPGEVTGFLGPTGRRRVTMALFAGVALVGSVLGLGLDGLIVFGVLLAF